jgi:predicted Fe-Mo cluster-binding NifX family protein
MRIALPLTATDEFSPHYGAAARFAIYEVDPARRALCRTTVVVPGDSEPCGWPPLLRAAGVELLLAGGMGRGALNRMAAHGVAVQTGVPAAAPAAIVTAWLEGRLETSANACEGGGHGGPHHGEDGQHHEGGACHCAH